VVFSHGTTLEQWRRGGLFDREVAYLGRLQERSGEVVALTYDRPGSAFNALNADISPIMARPNTTGLDYRLYGFLAPFIAPAVFEGIDLLRTTQISGSWLGALAARRFGMPFVLRCGYVRSVFYEQGGASRWRVTFARMVERFAIRSANRVFAATPSDIDDLVRISGAGRDKFILLPNPIDTATFAPADTLPPWRGELLFIGRLHEQKNLRPLIDMVNRHADCRLTIVGDGPLAGELHERAQTERIIFRGFVANDELPSLLTACDAFVLPSHFEGNPKSLLEAMSCGCAVIGARSPGIKNLIEHKVNGLLCDGDVDSLKQAVTQYATDPELRGHCREGARNLILREYDVDVIADREARIFMELLNERGQRETGGGP